MRHIFRCERNRTKMTPTIIGISKFYVISRARVKEWDASIPENIAEAAHTAFIAVALPVLAQLDEHE